MEERLTNEIVLILNKPMSELTKLDCRRLKMWYNRNSETKIEKCCCTRQTFELYYKKVKEIYDNQTTT